MEFSENVINATNEFQNLSNDNAQNFANIILKNPTFDICDLPDNAVQVYCVPVGSYEFSAGNIVNIFNHNILCLEPFAGYYNQPLSFLGLILKDYSIVSLNLNSANILPQKAYGEYIYCIPNCLGVLNIPRLEVFDSICDLANNQRPISYLKENCIIINSLEPIENITAIFSSTSSTSSTSYTVPKIQCLEPPEIMTCPNIKNLNFQNNNLGYFIREQDFQNLSANIQIFDANDYFIKFQKCIWLIQIPDEVTFTYTPPYKVLNGGVYDTDIPMSLESPEMQNLLNAVEPYDWTFLERRCIDGMVIIPLGPDLQFNTS